MKRYPLLFFCSILAVTLLFFGPWCIAETQTTAENTPASKVLVGGRCTYDTYEGKASIVRVLQTPASTKQADITGGPGYAGYEIWFTFTPNVPEATDKIGPIIAREHLFTLSNSWYVGPRYMEKYGIKVGSIYPCDLKVITQGTCSPVTFDFKTLNKTDYFETEK